MMGFPWSGGGMMYPAGNGMAYPAGNGIVYPAGNGMVYPAGETCSLGGNDGNGGNDSGCAQGAGGAGTGICVPGESGWIPTIWQPQPGCMGSNDMGLVPICLAPSVPPDN